MPGAVISTLCLEQTILPTGAIVSPILQRINLGDKRLFQETVRKSLEIPQFVSDRTGTQHGHSHSSIPPTAVLWGLPGACKSEGALNKIYVMGWQQDVVSLIYRWSGERYPQGRSPTWCLKLAWLKSPTCVCACVCVCVCAHVCVCVHTHLFVRLLKHHMGHRQASEKYTCEDHRRTLCN